MAQTVEFTNATLRASVQDDFFYPFIIETAVIDALYSTTVMRPLMWNTSLVGQASDTRRFPRWPNLVADDVAENVDLVNTEIVSTSVDITVGEIGITIALSDALQEDDILSGIMPYGRQGGLAVKDKMDADAAALLGGFSNSVTADLDEATFLGAIETLETADAPGPYCVVHHPRAVHQLRTDVVANGGNVYAGNPTQERRFGVTYSGYAFSLYEVDVYQTTNTSIIAGTPDTHAGAMFSKGYALAHVAKREARTEFQRDASARLTELNITSRYGVGEVVDEGGVTLLVAVA